MSRSERTDTVATPGVDSDEPGRPQRSDARRNRDLLLTAAAEVYDERGLDASLEEIARRANVGIGTLYRHFPTRDALTEAVYRREVSLLCDGVDDLLADNAGDAALALWMRRFAGYVAKKKGMAMALKSVLGADSELFSHSHQRIRDAIGSLVEAAAADGVIRADVDAEDLLRAMSGICMATDSPGWADRTERLVDLLVDGLRYGAPGPKSEAASRNTERGTSTPARRSGAGTARP
ncbi:MAG: TetR/AcrR family transcriptional regulator [Actinomycetota bacterium]|nr:TetR/AcrR family transcriptional regulator [Actinomycetota bacterium]